MTAAVASTETPNPDLAVSRSERIARGILLVQQGLTTREAGLRVGTCHTTLWRALQRLDAEWEQRDENAWRRATSKAEVVAEMVLERMLNGIDSCPPSVLPSWGMFAAKVAGWETVKEREGGGGDAVLASILDRLSKGSTVRVGVEVSPNSGIRDCNPPAPSLSPTIQPQTGAIEPLLGVVEGQGGLLSPPPMVVGADGDAEGGGRS